jgi:hypothetical protein
MMKLGRLTVEDGTGVARLRKRRRGSRFRQTKREEPVARSPSDGPTLLTGAAGTTRKRALNPWCDEGLRNY